MHSDALELVVRTAEASAVLTPEDWEATILRVRSLRTLAQDTCEAALESSPVDLIDALELDLLLRHLPAGEHVVQWHLHTSAQAVFGTAALRDVLADDWDWSCFLPTAGRWIPSLGEAPSFLHNLRRLEKLCDKFLAANSVLLACAAAIAIDAMSANFMSRCALYRIGRST